MAFFSNAQETSGRYGGYIAEFQELFGKREMKSGRPVDFLQLNPKLAHDEGFRREFTALTKSVGQREEGKLTQTRMLTILAIALGGPELEKIEKNPVSVSLVGVFLAGVGGWCIAEPESKLTERTPKVAELAPKAAAELTPKVVELESKPVDLEPKVAEREPESAESVLKADEPALEAVTAKTETPAIRMEPLPPVTKLDEAGGWGAIVAAVNDGSENEEEEREALELEQRLSAGPRSDAEGTTTSLFGGTALVKEALSRLEMNTLELKLHLDSIDHRMERIEPHLDDLTARISTTVESLPLSEINGRPKGLPMQRFSLPEIEEPQAVRPETVAAEAEKTKVKVDVAAPFISKPEEITRSRRLYWVAVVLAVLLLAGVVGMFFYNRHARESGVSRIGAVTAASRPGGADAVHGLDPPDRGGGNGAAGVVPAPRKTVALQAERQKVLKGAEQGGQGNTSGQVRGPDRNVPNQAGSSKTGLNQAEPEDRPTVPIRTEFGNQPGKIHVTKEEKPPASVANNVHIAAALPGAVASTKMPLVGRSTPEANVTAAKAADLPVSSADMHKVVFVPASALTQNLIASPKPIYPQVAHFQRTEGDVMVQALISEKGIVESVRVVSGPAALREAAAEAMRNWRYKPYLMGGKAVEVQTYVDFHFSLQR
jgi:TonB family protein